MERTIARLATAGLLLLASGCWAGWAPFETTPAGQRALPAPADPALVEAAGALPDLQGWTLVPLGQFERGVRSVLILWPAISPQGQVAQGSVMALTFTRVGDGPYQPTGEGWAVRGAATPAELSRSLGGQDYSMVPRHEGVPLSQLGPQLAARCQAFSASARAGDRRSAVFYAVEFTRLLSLDEAAYDNSAAHLLSLCSGGYDLEHLATRREGEAAAVQLGLHHRGARQQQVLAGARMAGEGSDQWVLTEIRWPSEG